MRRVLVLILAALWLSGCALTTERIDLSYVPQKGIAVIPGAHKITVNVQINDKRQEKGNKVSCKKNGFGMEMAPILANEDVKLTIKRAIEQELKSRGFSIGNEALISVIADLTRFWNDHKLGFFAGDSIADLNMTVTVKDNSMKVLYSRHIITQGVESNIQLMNGNNARLALDRALENGISLLFKDERFIATLVTLSVADVK